MLNVPDTPPQDMPAMIAQARQTQGSGAWNAPLYYGSFLGPMVHGNRVCPNRYVMYGTSM